uniref:protein disulfide-isomerase n=1 Tax=Aceria tosichella TaxID=561515 RepID=A0A6G1SNG5_9ACAR
MTNKPSSSIIILSTIYITITSLTLNLVRAHDEWGGSVVVLTESNFNAKVLDSNEIWLVNFYAPWCPHCKDLKPRFEEASRHIRKEGIKNVKLGAIDASEYQAFSQQYGIKGFPTLKYFPAGPKTASDAKDYDSDRSTAGILQWAKSMSAEVRPPPEVVEMTNEKVLKDSCGTSQLCVVSVLPPLFDCQSECRNRYINRLKEVAETFRAKQWAYLWVEANAQPELEKALEIGGFGYPALAAVNIRKMAYSLMRGPFSTEGITEFLKELSYGLGKSAPIKGAKLPEINKTTPWDGKDMELPNLDDEL